MNDVLMPEWMKKKHEADELAKAKEEARQQKLMTAALLIEREAPKFWKQLQEKIAIAVEFLPKLDMTGSITTFGSGMRVSVSCPGVFANQTYTDLFFNGEVRKIRCTTLNGGVYTLQFTVGPDDTVGVESSRDAIFMNVDQASEYVMRKMIEVIESRK